MKCEYDFTRAERGRFFRENAVPMPLLHLDADVLAVLTAQARARGVPLTELVNTLLRRDIEVLLCATPS